MMRVLYDYAENRVLFDDAAGQVLAGEGAVTPDYVDQQYECQFLPPGKTPQAIHVELAGFKDLFQLSDYKPAGYVRPNEYNINAYRGYQCYLDMNTMDGEYSTVHTYLLSPSHEWYQGGRCLWYGTSSASWRSYGLRPPSRILRKMGGDCRITYTQYAVFLSCEGSPEYPDVPDGYYVIQDWYMPSRFTWTAHTLWMYVMIRHNRIEVGVDAVGQYDSPAHPDVGMVVFYGFLSVPDLAVNGLVPERRYIVPNTAYVADSVPLPGGGCPAPDYCPVPWLPTVTVRV